MSISDKIIVNSQFNGKDCAIEYATKDNSFIIYSITYKNQFIETYQMSNEEYNWADAIINNLLGDTMPEFKRTYAPSTERREFPPMSLETIMPFGKHKGTSVRQTIISTTTNNGSYITWLMNNGGTNFTNEVIEFDKMCKLVFEKKPDVWEALFKEFEKTINTFVGASDDLVQLTPAEGDDNVGF